MTDIRSSADLEDELDREMNHLSALTDGGWSEKVEEDLVGFDVIANVAANAEADWKIAEARQLVAFANQKGEGRGEAEWKVRARTLALHADLYRTYKVAGAAKESNLEAIRSCRSRVDAIRTKNANRRGQD